MLIPSRLHPGILDGSVTVAFRGWKRPTVKAGGTLQTPAGLLEILSVDVIDESDITEADAVLAGEASVPDVVAGLRRGDDRSVHRIRFRRLGDDPRIALRDDAALDEAARSEVDARLRRMDAAAERPWTAATLSVISARPGTVSTELAAALGVERDVFKRRVRRLKALGLTESLEIGYRLSARGEAYFLQSGPSS